MPDTSLAVSTDFAHTGQYSVKLTNGAVSMSESAHLWRQDEYPAEAYYSAWFYLPRAYQTTADWSLVQFQVPPTADGGPIGQLLDIDLRSLPNGDLILSVYDHRAAYLRSPTPIRPSWSPSVSGSRSRPSIATRTTTADS